MSARLARQRRRVQRTQLAFTLAAALALAFATSSCKPASPGTQVMLVIDAESQVRTRIYDVDLEVHSGEGNLESWTSRFSGSLTQGSDTITWPLEVALSPRKGGLDRSYLVVATARGASGGAIARLRAISGYQSGKSLSLRLSFDERCLLRTDLCAQELTCMAGECVDPHVDVGSLLPFDESRPPGTTVSPTGANAGATGGEAGAGAAAGEGGSAAAPTGGSGGAPSLQCDQAVAPCAPVPLECPDELCGGCPDGFVQDGDACAPLLTGMSLSRGELLPALNANDTRYRIELPLLASDLTLAPLTADGVRLELDGAEVPQDEVFTLPELPLGETTLVATLTHAEHGSRTYTFTVSRQGAQRAYLKAGNSGKGDNFGFSVGASGETIVVGASSEDGGATAVNGADDDAIMDNGAAYVFVREGASFAQQAYLKPSTRGSGARFGHAVAIDGDTIAIGAPSRGAGAVYVFTRSGTTWQEQARLESGAPDTNGKFGIALALRGDVLFASAPDEDHGATGAGAVYVFKRSGVTWSPGVQQRSGSPQTLGWFGASLAFDGATLVVGANGETYGDAVGGGTAYVFTWNGSELQNGVQLHGSDTGPADFYGDSVAVDGDTVLVGASWGSPTTYGAGVVYVYARGDQGTFEQTARLAATNPGIDAFFGERIALSRDWLIVGATEEGSGATGINGDLTGPALARSGAAYVFARRAGVFTQVAHIKAATPGEGARFGSAVALLGDTIVVGADSEASAARGVDGDAADTTAPGSGALFTVR